MSGPSPSQNLLLRSTAQTRAEVLISFAHLRLARQLLSRRPDLPSLGFLAVEMLRDNLAHSVLEEERRFLELRVQLAVDKDAAVEVLLCVVAKDFVFAHDARVHLADALEVGVGGVAVAVDLVGHGRLVGAFWEEFLDHDEMCPVRVRKSPIRHQYRTHEIVMDALGK